MSSTTDRFETIVLTDDNIPVRGLSWLHKMIKENRASSVDLVECVCWLVERAFEQGVKHGIRSKQKPMLEVVS